MAVVDTESLSSNLLFSLLISLKSIIDAQLFAAHFLPDCNLASNRKSSRSLCIRLRLILTKLCALKGYKTCLCVHPLDQGACSPTASRLLCCIMLRNLEGYCGFTSPHPHTHTCTHAFTHHPALPNQSAFSPAVNGSEQKCCMDGLWLALC